MRIVKHPVLGDDSRGEDCSITVDGKVIPAVAGEPIAAALLAAGIKKFRETPKGSPRGIFCGIGRCTDCIMTVDNQPNVRTCVTPVQNGMVIETQKGLGKWADKI